MNQTVRTIKLSGVLGKRFGREFKFAVKSPAEAVSALAHQIPGFEAFLNESQEKYGLGYAVFVGKRNVGVDELRDPSGDEVIHFSPRLLGASGGTIQVILGAVLIVIGIILMFTPFAPLGSALIYAGAALMVSGIIMLLSPQPKDPVSEEEGKQTSYAFQGPVNTSAQGGCVPVFYGGPLTIGSAVISAGIIAEDNVHIPQPDGNFGGGGRRGGGSPTWRNLGNLAQPQQT